MAITPPLHHKLAITPLPYQKIAVRNAVQGFTINDRGQVIMACRTGKTFVGAFLVQEMKCRRVLLLVPNLGLVAQAIRDWQSCIVEPMKVLAVCSDKTVTRRHRDIDSPVFEIKDVKAVADVTTDPDEIAKFLRGDGFRVIVSTYQSCDKIELAQRKARVPAFDMAIADEAHHCACRTESEFGIILDEKRIRAKKRLFMTATPKQYTESAHRRAEEEEYTLSSMDDLKLFGPVFHQLSFEEAIRRKLICDYRLLVSSVSDEEILKQLVGKRKQKETLSKATQVAIINAVKEYEPRKVLAFLSRVSKARDFADTLIETHQAMPPSMRLPGTLWAKSISGEDKNRDQVLHEFGAMNGDSRCFLSNCRVLGEGVTAPDLEMVAYLTTPKSHIAIVQAFSRAIGLSKSNPNKVATFFVPAFFKDGDDANSVLSRKSFKPLMDVLAALRTVDGRVEAFIDAVVKAGKGGDSSKVELPVWLVLRGETGSGILRLAAAVKARVARVFSNQSIENKKIIIAMAMNGERPERGSPLYNAWKNYTNSNGSAFDHKFSELISPYAKGWMKRHPRRRATAENKKKLIAMSIRGESPKAGSRLYAAWKNYTCKGGSSYDSEFSRLISPYSGGWCKNRPYQRVGSEGIISLAKSGQLCRKKHFCSIKRFCNPSSKSYSHEAFDAVSKYCPEKLVTQKDRSKTFQDELKRGWLNQAKMGMSRPSRDSSRGSRLCTLRRLDAEFDEEISEYWPGKSIRKNKETLLKMARRGDSMPSAGREIGKCFLRYMKSDPSFRAQILLANEAWGVNTL